MPSLVSTIRLAVVGAILGLTTAQKGLKPIAEFCRRHMHQTCVIDSKLYIDGGLAFYGDSFNPEQLSPVSNTWLLSGDLSDKTASFPPLSDNLTKDVEVPTVGNGVLWPDHVNKLFYLFGGDYLNASVHDSVVLWFYDTIYDTWNRSKSDSSQAQVSWPSFGAGTVDDEGIGYYYGGYLSSTSVYGWQTDRLMLNTFVSYDTKIGRWSNTTWSQTPRAEGTLEYIPISDRGMLVYFGGLETVNGYTTYANMSQIHFFDFASQKSYTQTATGQIPQARRGFCSGIVWAKDRSSYNIYIYGGIGTSGAALGDVYVLSLPSFVWISLYPDPQLLTFPGGKAWSSCNVIYQSQMIVMGGFYTNTSKDRVTCDAKPDGGQHGILLGQEMEEQDNLWHAVMHNVTEYRVPQIIAKTIGGGVDGSATMTTPSLGWATSDLSIYFRSTYRAASRTASRPIPTTATPTATPSPSPTSTSKPKNVGAIAGGAVGGVFALMGVILIVLCLRRRRRNQQAASNNTANQPQAPQTPAMKSVADVSSSYGGSTIHSPNLHIPTYSPHGSPRHGRTSSAYAYNAESPEFSGSDWGQLDGIHHRWAQTGPQTYYPPPPEPLQAREPMEMPTVRSPPNEMPDVRSPIPVRGTNRNG